MQNSSPPLPAFDNAPALRNFQGWARLKAVKMALLSIEPVGWSEQTAQALTEAAKPGADSADKELAARLAFSEWESSPQKEASERALSRLMALPARDASGRWILYAPLLGEALRRDEKTGYGIKQLMSATRAGEFSERSLSLSGDVGNDFSPYPATAQALRIVDAPAGLENRAAHVFSALSSIAREHFNRVLGPAHALTHPQDGQEPPGVVQPEWELARWFYWDGPKLKSGVFAKAFKNLVDQGGLTRLGRSAIEAFSEGNWPSEWLEAARKLERGKSSKKTEMLGVIRAACQRVLTGRLPSGPEGLACVLLSTFGPGVDPALARQSASLERMWTVASESMPSQLQSWRPVVQFASKKWGDLPAQDAKKLYGEDKAGSTLAAQEALAKLAAASDALALEALGEAARAEAQWLRSAGLPQAAQALLASSASKRQVAFGPRLGLEEARAASQQETPFQGALRLSLAMVVTGRTSLDEAKKSRGRAFARLGLDAQGLASLEKSPWGGEFARCVDAALAAEVPQAQTWSNQACHAILCGFLALSRQAPPSLLAPLTDSQVERLGRAMRGQGAEPKFNFCPAWSGLRIDPEMEPHLGPASNVVKFFAAKAKEAQRQAAVMGLDFLGQALGEPALRVDPTLRELGVGTSQRVDGQKLPLAWAGEADWKAMEWRWEEKRRSEMRAIEQFHRKMQEARAESMARFSGPSSFSGHGFHPWDYYNPSLGFHGGFHGDGDRMSPEKSAVMERESHGAGGPARRRDSEAVKILENEGFAGKMAMVAMRAGRQPDMREGADAQSRANAWLGEAKNLAKEWFGISDAAWRGAKLDKQVGLEVLHAAMEIQEEREMWGVARHGGRDGKILGLFLNQAAAASLSARAACWASQVCEGNDFACGRVSLIRAQWEVLLSRCSDGASAATALMDAANEFEISEALRPRWIGAMIERADQLSKQTQAPAQEGDARDPFPSHAILDASRHLGWRRAASAVGRQVCDALQEELRDMRDWAKDWEGRFYSQLPPKLTWKTLAEGSRLWHEEALKRKGGGGTWEPIGAQWEGSGALAGWAAKELTTGQALAEEGRAMRHCVGSYASQCVDGPSRIISITQNGNRVSTLQLSTNVPSVGGVLEPAPRQWSVAQHRAVCNQQPPALARQAESEVLRAAIEASQEAFARFEAGPERSEQETQAQAKLQGELRAARADLDDWDKEVPAEIALSDRLREKLRARAQELQTQRVKQLAKSKGGKR